MGKLEKLGRSLLKRLRRHDNNATSSSSSSSSTSSDEETTTTSQKPSSFIHKIQINEENQNQNQMTSINSNSNSDRNSDGYATDLSSLSPLDVKRNSVDYSESQGYYSNAELSPIPRITVELEEDRITVGEPAHQSPSFYDSTTEVPLITVPKNTVGEGSGCSADPTVPKSGTVPFYDPRTNDPTVPLPLITVPKSTEHPRTTVVDPTVPLLGISPRITVPTHQTSIVPRDPITVPAHQIFQAPTVPLSPRITVEDAQITVGEPAHQSPSFYDPRTTVPLPLVTVPPAHLRTTVADPTVPLSPRITVPAHQKDPTVPLSSRITVPTHFDPTAPHSTVPKITVSSDQARTPLFIKNPTNREFPRINVKLHQNLSKSSTNLKQPEVAVERSATLSDLTETDEDPIDRFLKSAIYKTKMITTVFEAKEQGIEDISLDVIHEIDRWFESKNMMAVACEMHWSVPAEKRNRQVECRLKDKLLQALRENNKRLLYLRGMGCGKTPVKLAESKTVENISKDKENDAVRGIYQRSYTRLLPYLHKETPEWHSQYWTLQDLDSKSLNSSSTTSSTYNISCPPPSTDYSESPSKNSFISLNIIGLSILGNSRKSCGSLF